MRGASNVIIGAHKRVFNPLPFFSILHQFEPPNLGVMNDIVPALGSTLRWLPPEG